MFHGISERVQHDVPMTGDKLPRYRERCNDYQVLALCCNAIYFSFVAIRSFKRAGMSLLKILIVIHFSVRCKT